MSTLEKEVLNQEELDSLLVLKESQERNEVFTEAQTKEKEQLDLAYANYVQMNSKDMKAALQALRNVPKAVLVQGNKLNVMLKNYDTLYNKEPWYKTPEEKDGNLKLNFPTAEKLTEFMLIQAEEKIPHIIVDATTKKVMGYSNGDGKLRHPDGSVVNKGDTLKLSDFDLSAFKIPQSKAAQTALLLPLPDSDDVEEEESNRLSV